MESFCFAIFLLIFFGFAALLAAPVAVAFGGKIASDQKQLPPNERHQNPVLMAIICFILLMIAACIVLGIWNPTF
jgi:hypothetical protein